MRYLVFLLLFLVVTISYSQDTIVKKPNPFSDAAMGHFINAQIIQQKLEVDKKSSDLSYLFISKKKKNQINFNPNIKNYFKKEPKKSILEIPKMDDDIVVIKHFNGKNTTNKNFKTEQYLGTIESNTKFVRIAYRDFGLVDGDRVKIYLNKVPIASNITLDGGFYVIHIDLNTKGFHRIDIEALNQGVYGPNTAEFIVYDDKGNAILHKSWELSKGTIATLGIVRR